MSKDPYTYPDSDVLINHLDITDDILLHAAEAHFVQFRQFEGIPDGNLDYAHLKNIHHHIFQDLYSWAGEERTISISKGNSLFAIPEQITPYLMSVFNKLSNENHLSGSNLQQFTEKASYYFGEINAVHAFREGNGRTQRIFMDKLAEKSGFELAWKNINTHDYIQASIDTFNGQHQSMCHVFAQITRPISSKLMLVSDEEKLDGSAVSSIIKTYLSKKNKLSELVRSKIIAMNNNLKESRQLAEKSTSLMKEINEFCKQSMKNQNVMEIFLQMEKTPTPSIPVNKFGGLEDIERNLRQRGYISEEETRAVLQHMRAELQSHSARHTHDLVNGGGISRKN